MFSRKKNKPARVETVIGGALTIEGDLFFTGGVHVDGKIRGNITAEGDPTAVVIISEHAEIEGEVHVPHVVLNGKVNGNVYASEKAELHQQAQVCGNVYYKMLEIAMGAEVNGQLVKASDDSVFDRNAEASQAAQSVEHDSKVTFIDPASN